MIDKIVTACADISTYVYEKSMSGYELITKVMEKLNEVIDEVNSFRNDIDAKEDSDNITYSRLLSGNGNFTGRWDGNSITEILSQIDNNEDQIDYIAQQFSDGQTGFVINGGFFEETGIRDNYNGGVF